MVKNPGVCCASRVKPQKIACQAIFYPANSENNPDNQDFCVTDGAKIHKRNRLLGEHNMISEAVLIPLSRRW
jgi:hypothetical protein